MQTPPTYLRARMDLIRENLSSANEMPAALLRNGVYYDQKPLKRKQSQSHIHKRH
jgi:hypothetical protein